MSPQAEQAMWRQLGHPQNVETKGPMQTCVPPEVMAEQQRLLHMAQQQQLLQQQQQQVHQQQQELQRQQMEYDHQVQAATWEAARHAQQQYSPQRSTCSASSSGGDSCQHAQQQYTPSGSPKVLSPHDVNPGMCGIDASKQLFPDQPVPDATNGTTTSSA